MALLSVVADPKESARETLVAVLGSRYRQDFTEILDAIAVYGTEEQVKERAEEYWDVGIDDLVWSPHVHHEATIERAEPQAGAFQC